MKKLTYLLVFMFATVLISTSCCKEDDPILDDPNAEYLGMWYNTETLVNGVVDDGNDVLHYEFEFEVIKLTVTANNNSNTERVYSSWSISGTTLTAMFEGMPEVYTISSPPNNGKLTLSYSYNGNVYTYKLSQ